MPHPARFLWLLVALLLGACAGPKDPLDAKIDARTAHGFQVWRSNHADEQGPEAKREIDDALQELRFELMDRFRLADSVRVDEALRAATHERTVREVLVRAWRHKHARLDGERRLLRGVVRINANGEPLNVETARTLENTLERQVRRLDQLEEEISRLEKRLAALGSPVAPDPLAIPPSPAAPLPTAPGDGGSNRGAA
jgi:hypothetical protein